MYIYIDGVVQVANTRVLEKWIELLRAKGGRFEINQLLFTDETVLVADSKEMCRLMSESG